MLPHRPRAFRNLRLTIALLATVVVPICGAAPRLAAQARPLSLAVGGGWPQGDQALAARWRDAWLARVALTVGTPARRLRGRLTHEQARWVARSPTARGPTLTDHAVLLEALLGPRVPPPLHPYVVLELGQHRLSIPGDRNPYGRAPGVGAGLGLTLALPRRVARGCAFDAEVRRRLVLTDYGVGAWNVHSSTPVTLSLRC